MEWARAVILHSGAFDSPLWTRVYTSPTELSKRFWAVMKPITYLVERQLQSGMSFGIFDLEYKFKRPQSEASGGRVYWHEKQDQRINGEEMLELMDIPLVAVALTYDGANENMARTRALVRVLPPLEIICSDLEFDSMGKNWKPREPKRVLMVNAMCTLRNHTGNGLMKTLSHFIMRQAKQEGYRVIRIDSAHDGILKTWESPPAPFGAEMIAMCDCRLYPQEDKKGRVFYPFNEAWQVLFRVHVHLDTSAAGRQWERVVSLEAYGPDWMEFYSDSEK
ncbi:hypothetical protein H2203_004150 [Taxawa tesnikishii (nom. ined.)]|nr:hypothetical protein H2203_004150 [Dothideales sp. JES 119]